MKKRFFYIVLHMFTFVFVSMFIGGIKSPSGTFGYVLAGFVYGVLMMALPEMLKFFKFPDNFWAKMLIGTLFTLGLFFALQYLPEKTQIVKFGPGSIGVGDFILFKASLYLKLTSQFVMIFVAALIYNLCSIIVDKLAE